MDKKENREVLRKTYRKHVEAIIAESDAPYARDVDTFIAFDSKLSEIILNYKGSDIDNYTGETMGEFLMAHPEMVKEATEWALNATKKKDETPLVNEPSHEPLLATIAKDTPYFNQSTTALNNLLKKTLNNPTRIESTRKGQITHKYDDITQAIRLTYEGADANYAVTIGQAKTLFAKRVQNGAKIFNFLLKKLNEQNYQEDTEFFLKELVDLGIYANLDSAYRGVKTVTDKLMNIHVEGKITVYQGRKRKERYNVKSGVVMFREISYNKCLVKLPPIIRNASQNVTILPVWAYALESENAHMLIDYIFYLARQNADKLKERGYFTMSLETVRIQLGLPSPDEVKESHNRNYNLHIINPIEEAIAAIEKNQLENELTITPIYSHDYKNIDEYLDGYLEIRLCGKALEYMENRALIQEEKQAETKRLEEKKEIAIAVAMEKKYTDRNNEAHHQLAETPKEPLKKRMTASEKRELIRKHLEETPEKSDRQIAKEVGAHHSTVSTQRKK